MKKLVGLVLNDPIAYSETFFYNDIEILEKAGYSVIVFTGYSKKKEEFTHVRAFPTSFATLNDYWFLLRGLLKLVLKGLTPAFKLYKREKKQGSSFIRILKRIYLSGHILPHKVDYLHFGFATSALQREWVAKSIGAKMSVSLRGYDIGVYPLLHPGCYNLLWALVYKVHITSKDLYLAAISNGMHENVSHQLISYAINKNLIPAKQTFSAHNQINILTIGRIHWKKGYEYSLQAIQKLKEKGLSIRYTIIGSGPQYDQVIYTIHELGLQDHVTIKEPIPYQEILNLMHQYEIYLQPSVQEGFCCAALEAQAAGLLVIATDAEGLQENIEHEKSGWIVEKRNVEALSSKIIDVINLPLSRKIEISNYARNRVAGKFSLENNIHKWQLFFN